MKIYRFFIGLSFIGITLFVLLIRPVLGSAQLDYENGEYFNEETTMFQYDENGDVLINRDNYNFMEQGSILFETVNVEDENGNVIGTEKQLLLMSSIDNIISPVLEITSTISKFFGITPPVDPLLDVNLYDYIIYQEGYEGSSGHILYDLTNVYDQPSALGTDVFVNFARTYTFISETIRYYYESQTYWKLTSIGPITFNYQKINENELLEYLQEHYPEYLN